MKTFSELWKASKAIFGQTQYKNRAEWTVEQFLTQEREESCRWIPVEEDLPEDLVEKREHEVFGNRFYSTKTVLVKCYDPVFKLESYHTARREGSIDKKQWRWQSDSTNFNVKHIVGWRRIEG
jgi:hypothetical protein